jgi:hypothetical protein
MTVRVTIAPLSVMTCMLVDGAVAEEVTTALAVDDGLLSEDDCMLLLAYVGDRGVGWVKKRD